MRKKMKKVYKGKILMRIVAMLFCLVSLSTVMMLGLYGRYTSGKSSADGARVISFGDLTTTENGNFTTVDGVNQFIFIPGVPLQKEILVSFDGSESATIVFVEIKTKGWSTDDHINYSLAGGEMTWCVDTENWKYLDLGSDTKENTHVYYKHLDANEQLKPTSVILNNQILVSIEKGTVEAYKAYAEKEICIDVTTYVVQSNGFENEKAAWTSVSGK